MNSVKGSRAKIAGILNLTPDSFYSSSRHLHSVDIARAVARLCNEGADMIDIGACSTRPGSIPVSQQEELHRLMEGMPPVLEAHGNTTLSVDTFRPEIASECITRWNVSVINDISGGCDDMFRTVAESGATYILTYNQTAETEILRDMLSFFGRKLDCLDKAGCDKVIIDPGFGFGKSIEQNYQILANLTLLKQFGCPIMAGVSRKSMAYELLGITPEDSLEATVALNTLAMAGGAEWLRVHDVKAAVQASLIFSAYSNNK